MPVRQRSIRPARKLQKTASAALAVTLVAGASVLAAPSAAFAAEPFLPSQLLATQSGTSSILSVDRATGATTVALTVPGGVTGLNQIGVSGDGGTVVLTNSSTIFEYTASSETWQTTPRTGVTVPNTMGAVDPDSGLFYFGGRPSGSSFAFATYDPATNALSPSFTVSAPNPPGGNGDLTFDSRGNMFFVAGSTTSAQIYRVDADQLGEPGATAVTIGPIIDAGLALNSMAFADDGFLYVAGGGADGFLRVNPTTGDVVETRTLDAMITDLGTNALPFTGDLSIELPGGRVNEGDQFTVTIGGGGVTTGNTGTTTGDETSATIGPILLLPGETYTVEQTPAGTTDPDDYVTSWECRDAATGDLIDSGTGASGEFTIPSTVQDATCSFTSVPKALGAPDVSADNPQGEPVTVDVIGNDLGDLDPESVRIIDGEGEPVTELVVPGEGTWTVDTATGDITFTPEAGFSGNPTPITYAVTDTDGNTSEAGVTVTYAPLAQDDSSLDNAQGTTVVVDALANDLGELDPRTVRLIDGSDLVTELVVADEGTWTVDTATGDITFTPEAGFLGNPTSISYAVTDVLGNGTQADVIVTYAPEAQDDSSLGNPQGDPVTVDVLANDLGDLDPTTVRIVDGSDLVTELVVTGEGTWTVDTVTGDIVFTPEAGFSGNPAPITYQVSDELDAATRAAVVVTFLPGAQDDSSLDNTQGEPVTMDVLANDLGELDPTTVVIIHGGDLVTELIVSGEGTWTVNPTTGAITFTPEAGFSGNPTPITYGVDDVLANGTAADVIVTYAPEAQDDSSLGNTQGEPVTVDVLANDLGDHDPTSVRIIDGGDLVTELIVAGEGTWAVNPTTGAITFTPETGFSGNPTPITYAVTDELENTVEAAVVVTYAPVTESDVSAGNDQGATVTLDVLANDRGALDASSVRILDADGDPVTELVVAGEGTWVVDPSTGAITFTPAAGFHGNPTPITYMVTDAEGLAAQALVTVTYGAQATSDVSRGHTPGQPVTVDVIGNDLGDLDPTSVRIVDGSGALVTQLVVRGEGTWSADPLTGAITFTPEAGFTSSPTPITYEVADLEGGTSRATVSISYAPVVAALPVTGAEPFGVLGLGLALAALGGLLIAARTRIHRSA